MLKYIHENKKKFIGIIVVIAVLLFAFWYGNGNQSSRGFSLNDGKDVTQAAAEDENVSKNTGTEDLDIKEDALIADAEESYSDSVINSNGDSKENGQNTNSNNGDKIQGNTEATESENSEKEIQENTTQENTAQDQSQQNGKPVEGENENNSISCTISISCATILNNMDQLKPNKKDLVPSDGWILKPQTITVTSGESVYDVLSQICRSNQIHMEATVSSLYQTAYVEGINNIYQFDCGTGSGWNYKVNGSMASVGASAYKVKDGDVIEWKYTCDMGRDI